MWSGTKRSCGSKEEIRRLLETIQTYEQLAEAVREARVVDPGIYTGTGHSEWLEIDREDYTNMIAILSCLDVWKPWNSINVHCNS